MRAAVGRPTSVFHRGQTSRAYGHRVDQNPAPPLFAAVVGGAVFGAAVVGGAVVGGAVVAGATVVAEPAAGADDVGAVVGESWVPTVFELEPHAATPTLKIATHITGAMRRRTPLPTAGPIRITSFTFLVHREIQKGCTTATRRGISRGRNISAQLPNFYWTEPGKRCSTAADASAVACTFMLTSRRLTGRRSSRSPRARIRRQSRPTSRRRSRAAAGR